MLENIHYILDRMKFTTFKDWLSIFKFLIAYPVALVFKRKHRKLWLICDTGDQARDNGYWLYKYIRENHPAGRRQKHSGCPQDGFVCGIGVQQFPQYGQQHPWQQMASALFPAALIIT